MAKKKPAGKGRPAAKKPPRAPPKPPHKGGKVDQTTAQQLERRNRAMDMRIQGASYRHIALMLRISVSTAHLDVMAAADELRVDLGEKTEQARAIELERLNRLRLTMMGEASGQRTPDGKGWVAPPDVSAGGLCVKISERVSKLMGLDKPDPFAGGSPGASQSAIDARIRQWSPAKLAAFIQLAQDAEAELEASGATQPAAEQDRSGGGNAAAIPRRPGAIAKQPKR